MEGTRRSELRLTNAITATHLLASPRCVRGIPSSAAMPEADVIPGSQKPYAQQGKEHIWPRQEKAETEGRQGKSWTFKVKKKAICLWGFGTRVEALGFRDYCLRLFCAPKTMSTWMPRSYSLHSSNKKP